MPSPKPPARTPRAISPTRSTCCASCTEAIPAWSSWHFRCTPAGPAHSWLGRATDGFERERLYLVRLTAAVGPQPSTPGAAETESALVAQRHALEILARSERSGCALGAATALVSDWWPIRRLLDRAAARVGIECPAPSLPDEAVGDGSDRLRLRHPGERARARVRRRAIAAPAPRPVGPARGKGRRARPPGRLTREAEVPASDA